MTAEPITAAAVIQKELVTQLTSPVQWQKSVEYMTGHGISRYLEIGPGQVLAGLIKRISTDVEVSNFSDLASIKGLA